MASEGKHPNEFRRYRQGLIALYFAIVAAGGALLVASVAWQLIVPRSGPHSGPQRGPETAESADAQEPPISVEDPDPEALLHCHAELSELLTRLGTAAGELVSAPIHDGRADIGAAWIERSDAWGSDYERVGARCRFPELAAAHRGTALERMAEVYAGLPARRETYQQLLKQFDDDLAGELARAQRALDRSREALLRRHRAALSP